MIARLVRQTGAFLSATGRKRVRRVADLLLAPVGSINGVRLPSRSVALTFDDGPDARVTPRLLDLLSARGSRATFFVITERVLENPDLVRRMVAEGHEVALHADRHDRLTALSIGELWRRLAAAKQRLEGVIGRPVRFFRPPFGSQSIVTYLVARACGLDVVVWGPFAKDWIEAAPEAVAARGLTGLVGGDVLLLHDGLDSPPGTPIPTFDRVRAFELILDGLAERGLRSSTVGELVAAGQPRRTAWFRP